MSIQIFPGSESFLKGFSPNPQKDVELLWNQPFCLLQEASSTILPKK
jgi:hypothetical protein